MFITEVLWKQMVIFYASLVIMSYANVAGSEFDASYNRGTPVSLPGTIDISRLMSFSFLLRSVRAR
jgi:hypothetical protein